MISEEMAKDLVMLATLNCGLTKEVAERIRQEVKSLIDIYRDDEIEALLR
jgi:hypothetical protein